MSSKDLIRLGLMDPPSLTSLALRDWDLLIRQGRSAEVLGRLHALMEQQDLLHEIPLAPRNHLQGARLIATSQERVIRWEVHCIERALLPVQTEFVLLKEPPTSCPDCRLLKGAFNPMSISWYPGRI